jgi:lysyl-tRNA synthetase class 2
MAEHLDQETPVCTSDLRAMRLQKLEALREAQEDPYQANWDQTHTAQEAIQTFEADESTTASFSVAGRILLFRLMGKASFVKIQDRTGILQLYVSKDDLGEEAYNSFKKLDLGDIIGASGTLFRTKTGEITLRAQSYALVSKALRPLPEKWHGLSNDEQIYRQRYLDLIVNPDSRERFLKRSRIIQGIREFLWSRDFTEFETPVFQAVAGGAAARPFTTHMQALNHTFYLRISLELYLKRLLVGGFDRVFELSRVFRNEGLSRRHNPEFTMLELYQAYSDYKGMMQLVYDLVQFLCEKVLGTTQIQQPNGTVLELGGQWKTIAYHDLVRERTEMPNWFELSKEEKIAFCQSQGLEIAPQWEDFEVTQEFYSKRIEPTLIQPTFVTHLPRELCPLAKLNPKDPRVLDVFELCINGQEIAPAYSEQNDPLLQRELFEKQIGDDKQNMDEDFLVALEHGMPPAGGMGIGIDRLCILLTGAESIRDVILFPQMKNL